MQRKTGNGSLWESVNSNYSNHIELVNRFYAPELLSILRDIDLDTVSSILDAGCGTGFVTHLIASRATKEPLVVGCNLSFPHLIAAAKYSSSILWTNADINHLPYPDDQFDLVWCAKTIWSLPNPVHGLHELRRVTRPGGRVIIVEAGLGLGMLIPWNTALELRLRYAQEQLRQDYFSRHPPLPITTQRRNLIGLLRAAHCDSFSVRNYVIDRIGPLDQADRKALQAILKESFGSDIRPYLSKEEWEEWSSMCNPESQNYLLARDDFHCMIVLTVITCFI